MHNTFGSGDSKTFQTTSQTFSIAYGSGTVSGSLVKDTISVAGLKLSMSFGTATDTSDQFTHFPFDGILGLSSRAGATDNFLQVLQSSKAVGSNVFGVSLSRTSDGPNNGEITFGGTDSSKYTGSISYTPVSSGGGGDWAIQMDDLSFDGKKSGVSNRLTYIDTGTSYMFGPPADIAALHKLIPGSASSDGITYTVPCGTTTPVTVTFAGASFTISSKDWVSATGTTCTSNFYGYAVVPDAWLLGDQFLKNVYAVFDADQKRIGFAAKPAVAGAPGTPAPTSTTSSPPSSLDSGTGSSSLITPVPSGSSSSSGTIPGLTGHETSVTVATPVPQTTGASTGTTVTSPADHLEGNKYASIIIIVAVIAMVA
jgi:hypothetical protein